MSYEYNVKPRLNDRTSYEVHKFDGGSMPITTYIVKVYHGKLTCNCPAGVYRGRCKHTNMVREYRRKERSLGLESMMNIVIFKE